MLLSMIVILQVCCFYWNTQAPEEVSIDEQQWKSLQQQLDSLTPSQNYPRFELRPYNPNFISDSKAYRLGMTVAQYDRLMAYRNQGKFVNSAAEFQSVTGVSDSLLQAMAPYFKFPAWVNSYKNTAYSKSDTLPRRKWVSYPAKEVLPIMDLNEATKDDLIKIKGIGEALSERILYQKSLYGGFVSMDQLTEIWGLSPLVIEELRAHFQISKLPVLKKININNASIKELEQFIYFKYPLSKNIVTYRSMNGDIKIEDLSKIKGFPVDKIKIIALYLEF